MQVLWHCSKVFHLSAEEIVATMDVLHNVTVKIAGKLFFPLNWKVKVKGLPHDFIVYAQKGGCIMRMLRLISTSI